MPLSPEYLDALCELDNITLGSAATKLEGIAGIQVKMIKPKAEELPFSEAMAKLPEEPKKAVIMEYSGDYGGEMAFVFKKDDLDHLLSAVASSQGIDSPEVALSQKMAEGINETLAMLISRKNLKCLAGSVIEEVPGFEGDVVFIEMQFRLDEGKVSSHFWHIVPSQLGERLAGDMLGELSAQLEEFEVKAKDSRDKKALEEERPVEDVPDVMVRLSVVLANKRMLFQDLWDLNPGSVIEFPQYVSQPVDVVLNGKSIAKAQVVTVGEKFGVRITEVSDYVKGIGG